MYYCLRDRTVGINHSTECYVMCHRESGSVVRKWCIDRLHTVEGRDTLLEKYMGSMRLC